MTNADKFKNIFGLYATELWSMPEKDFLKWLNSKVVNCQQEIIRCKDCKHWNPQLKTANGNGLGSCDFHNAALVTSEGFCYWAEKRGEE